VILPSYTSMRAVFATTTTLGNDGHPVFPEAEYTNQDFSLSGTTKYTASFAFPKRVQMWAVGGVAVDTGEDHHAYLSQRSDVAANQWLELGEYNTTTDIWTLSLTHEAVEAFDLALTTSVLSEPILRRILKGVYLYTQRISDDSVRVCDLTRLVFSDY
jgi:hypothetical protein